MATKRSPHYVTVHFDMADIDGRAAYEIHSSAPNMHSFIHSLHDELRLMWKYGNGVKRGKVPVETLRELFFRLMEENKIEV